MQSRTAIILFFSIITSILVLIALIVFLYKISKLYNKKQLEFLDGIKILTLEKEKELLNSRIEVQEETFQLIGREIHDNINQLLTLSKLNLNTIDFNEPVELKNKILNSKQFIGEAIQGLTSISKTLNTDLIKESGITEILTQEILRINSLKSTKINFIFTDEINEISPEIQLILFRISQEAIRNAIIHGHSENIEIKMSLNNNLLEFEIKDNGIGFDIKSLAEKKFSQGIKNIEKRIKSINGTFSINSEIKSGTNLIIQIPVLFNKQPETNL